MKIKIKQSGFIKNTLQARSKPVKRDNGPQIPGLYGLNEGFSGWRLICIQRWLKRTKLYNYTSVPDLTHNAYGETQGP